MYNNLSHLYKPENDVNTLSCLLKNLGFLVIALQNLNLIEMRNSIYMFAKLLPSDAYGMFLGCLLPNMKKRNQSKVNLIENV